MGNRKRRGRTVQRERRIFHGDYLTVHVFPIWQYQKQSKRRKKSKPTSDIQKKLNQRYREDRVTYLINENFHKHDIEIGLGFENEYLPDTYADCQRIIRNYLRSIKRLRRKYDLDELKYLYAIEKGERNGRFHAHLLMNGVGENDVVQTGIDYVTDEETGEIKPMPIFKSYRKMIEELWERYGGRQGRSFSLDFDDNGLKGLAKYKVKEPETATEQIDGKVHRWAASKNLRPPRIPKDRDGYISRDTVEDIRNGNRTEREMERLYPGYTVTDWSAVKNDINAGEYLTIQLRTTKSSRETKQIFKTGKRKTNRSCAQINIMRRCSREEVKVC